MSVIKVSRVQLLVVHTSGGVFTLVDPATGRHFQIHSTDGGKPAHEPLAALCELIINAMETST